MLKKKEERDKQEKQMPSIFIRKKEVWNKRMSRVISQSTGNNPINEILKSAVLIK